MITVVITPDTTDGSTSAVPSIAAWVVLGEAVTLAQALSMSVVLVALGVLAYREAREDRVVLDDALT